MKQFLLRFTNFIAVFVLLSICNNAFATHSVGADISYTCLGGNTYRITLNFYRDCAGVSAPTYATVNISSASCGRYLTVRLNKKSQMQVPALCPLQLGNTTCNGGSLPGIEQHVYEGVVNLGRKCTDWRIGYDLCCRNNAITNLASPGNQDMYVEATLNNVIGCNNAPFFTTLPVPYVCGNQLIFYNHGAVDIDGDQLVYTLINPLDGPGINIPYTGGYNVNRPMSLNSPLNFNSNNGQLEFNPRSNQNVVVTILVQEYRNGQLIGSTMRDIQIVVLPCANNTPPSMTGMDGTNVYEVDICAGQNICFDIFSSDPNQSQIVTMAWNQGISSGTFNINNNNNRPIGTFCWTPTPQNVGSNVFTVTVQDNACPLFASEVKAYTINVTGSSFTSTATVTDLVCNGVPTGAISISLSGAVPPITYQWDNGSTQSSVSGLLAGQHTVTIASGSCTEVKTITVNQPPPIIIDFVTTPATCNGDDNGSATATITGGTSSTGVYGMLWDYPPPNTLNFIDSLASGWYVFSATDDNSCVVTDSVFVFQPGPLIIQADASSTSNYNGAEISCYGAADGEVTVTATGGTLPYTYTWSSNANGQTGSVINNLDVGTYSVTLFDQNGCNTGASTSITQPDPVVITNIVQTQPIDCNGNQNGALLVTTTGGTPGYTYTWTGDAAGQNTDAPTGLGPGTYNVTVADLNGCSADTFITITEPDPLTGTLSIYTIINGYAISCNGLNDGTLLMDVTGGTRPYSFQWSQGGSTDPFVAGLYAGTYTVTVTDTNGCTITATETLTEPPPITVSAAITSNYNGQDVSCFGAFDGEATATPGGGVPPYSFDWNDPTNQGTPVATGLGANITYVVTVTDTSECSIVDSVILTEPDPVVATTTVTSNYNGQDVSCFGAGDGSSLVTATGGTPGYTYQWDAAANNQTVDEAMNLAAGIYDVIVTDLNGCADTIDVVITEPDSLDPSTSVTSNYNGEDISCFGASDGMVNANATGGTGPYEYYWETNTTGVSNPDATGLSMGSYNVTVSDANNCTVVASIALSEPLPISTVPDGDDLLCFEDNTGQVSVVASGGTPGFSYAWNTNPPQNVQNATGLPMGDYTVTVTDLNGCQNVDSISIGQPPLLTVSPNSEPATCYNSSDGSASVTAAGGTVPYSYAWSTGLNGPLSPNSDNIPQGIYGVTVTDDNNCTFSLSIPVDAPPPPVISVDATPDTINFGETTDLLATVISDAGVPGGAFEWEWHESLNCIYCDENQASPVYSTTYVVYYTDGNGCPVSKEVRVEVDPYTRIFFVPNAFTPNGDDVNDVFNFEALGVAASNLKVFDRWGEKVFESANKSVGWDGIFRGERSRPGVYVFYVEVDYLDGFSETRAGSVTLIR